MVLHSQNISIRESALLTLGTSLLLLLAHYYFGVLGLLGALGLALTILLIPTLQSVKGAFLLIYFIASILVLDTYEGIQVIELPFFGLSIILILFVTYKFLTGSLILENALDYLFLLLHFLIPYAVILGKFNGASTYTALGEVVYFLGIFTYFPLREYLKNESFKKALAIIILVMLGFVLIRNFVYYRQILVQALLPWETESARVAANELIIVIGCSFTLVLASLTKSKLVQYISTVLFLIFVVSLVLTQSRGYWIAGFFSVVTIFLVINRHGKKRILITAFVMSVLGITIANVFFDDFLTLIVNGLNDRFQSIGSGTTDNSLQDRWLESKTVFSHIIENPIAGYGFGVEFTRKVLFFDTFIQTSYVHNGYLGSMYKFGILGFFAFIGIWLSIFKKSYSIYSKSVSKVEKIYSLAFIGIITGLLFANITSPQILTIEGCLFTALSGAFVNQLSTKKFE